MPGVGRFRFDTGPHVLTMLWAVEALFRDLGSAREDFLHPVRMDPICCYHFVREAPFDAPADPEEAARRVSARFPGDEQGFRALLAYARRVYDASVEPFLQQDFARAVRGIPSPAQWRQLARFIGLVPWRTLHAQVARHIRHPELRRIFDLYALYNGSSPLRASAIFAIIAWVQWGLGTFADTLAKMAERLKVDVHTGVRVERILVAGRPGRVTGVELAEHGSLPADAVVCNADPLTAYRDLVPPEYRPPALRDEALAGAELSTSAFVLLLGVRGSYPHLAHYNSFLPARPCSRRRSGDRYHLPEHDGAGMRAAGPLEPVCDDLPARALGRFCLDTGADGGLPRASDRASRDALPDAGGSGTHRLRAGLDPP